MRRFRGYALSSWFVFVASVATISCGGCDEDEQHEFDAHGQALRQQAIWRDHGITSYEYRLHQLCFCDDVTKLPVVVTVADEAIVAVRDTGADTLVSAEFWGRFKTIEDLFDIVIRATQQADRLQVEYDEMYGFPAKIDIYWDLHATDNGWLADASELERLQG